MIYFDNAATSYPKPVSVINAVADSLRKYGANPGRGGYKASLETAEKIYETRCVINDFFNGYGEEYVSFTGNCTQALNYAIQGLLKDGEHIIISSLEHNSVARPVHILSCERNISYSVFEVGGDVCKTLADFESCFRDNTRLCVFTAVSNVLGTVLPLKELCAVAHSRGAAVIVDGAQGAGTFDIDMKRDGIDCLCVPGHKGLRGPMGTGALIHNGIDFKPLITGGTGTDSLSLLQQTRFPEYMESGTLNVPGICGLCEGVKWVVRTGRENILKSEKAACDEIRKTLGNMAGIRLCVGNNSNMYGNIVSFNIKDMHSEQVADILGRNGVCVRGGYHCSYLAHKYNKTLQQGAVRISPSENNTQKDINILLNLINKIAIGKLI